MSNITQVKRLTIKTYTQEDKSKAWQKIVKAKEYLSQAFYIKNNRDLIKSALSLYEEAFKIYPEYAEIYIGIGYISYISGDTVKAISFLYNALDIDSNNKDALDMLSLFKQNLEKDIQSKQVSKVSNKTLDKVMGIQMPVQSKVIASKGFLSSVKKAFSW